MRFYNSYFHISTVVLFLAGGIIVATSFCMFFPSFSKPIVECFSSPWWLVFVCISIVLFFLRPYKKLGLLMLACGMTIGFLRFSSVTNYQKPNKIDAISYSKTWLIDRISSNLTEENANLGTAYLLGEKDGLSDQFKEYLQVAGLSHVVVASGAHLSIIVGFVWKIFGRISRKTGVVFALIFVLIFMALIGWTPSILRAGIMTILTLLSWYNGRKFQSYKLILITAAITLLINPSFVSDLGWQLSFASYSGIMLLGPSVIFYFYGEKKPGFVGSMVITTISATLLVAPISLYYFGSLSLIALAANILILPTLSIAMGLTFATGIFAGVPIVGNIFAWCSGLLLGFHRIIIEFLGTKHYLLITISKQNPAVFLLYFVILFPFGVSIFRNRRKVSKKSIKHSFVIPSREKDNIGTRGWTISRKNAKISKI